jgi:chemotaxis signal transduction protein
MTGESQWVTFAAGKETYGFEIEYVHEMLRLPSVHQVPQSPVDMLGVMMLRNRVLPVYDLCKRFGLLSLSDRTQQLVTLLGERLKDHHNWMAELTRSVDEDREFTLTLDPHACKFGVWYDQFQTDDPWLASQLRHFDLPHKRIHALGAEVVSLRKHSETENCRGLVRAGRETTLRELAKLFGDTIELVQDRGRPSVIVVGHGQVTLAVAVDTIQAVVRCRAEEIQPADILPENVDGSAVVGLLPQPGDSRLVILLDPRVLYSQLAECEA